eukprot:scaffold1311_cov256-Pinguiococcus_pyrenoidosus.AAC.47
MQANALDCCRILIESGADATQRNVYLNHVTNEYKTFDHAASVAELYHHTRLMEYLLPHCNSVESASKSNPRKEKLALNTELGAAARDADGGAAGTTEAFILRSPFGRQSMKRAARFAA